MSDEIDRHAEDGESWKPEDGHQLHDGPPHWDSGNVVDIEAIKNRRAMSFDDWLELGEREGFVTARFCAMHDGLPLTKDEAEGFEEGDDPCIAAIRVKPS